MIQIDCLQYHDLGISVDPENLSEAELKRIMREAQRIAATCNARCMGGDCPGNCPIPRVGVANLGQIKSAITSLT